jgi:hypothetical protein
MLPQVLPRRQENTAVEALGFAKAESVKTVRQDGSQMDQDLIDKIAKASRLAIDEMEELIKKTQEDIEHLRALEGRLSRILLRMEERR